MVHYMISRLIISKRMASSYFLKNLPSRNVLETMRVDFPMLDVGAAEVFIVLSKLSGNILEKLDGQLADSGTSQAQLCVLSHLFRQPDEACAPSALADAIGLSRPTITGLLDRLEREGLLQRVRPPGKDRRSLQIKLAAKGRRLVLAVMPARLRGIAGLMTHLNGTDRKALIKLLDKIAKGLPALEKR